MKKIKFITSILMAMFFAGMIGTLFGAPAGVAALGGSLLFKAPKGVMMMSVTPEIWTDYIIGNLFKNNEWIINSVDESQYVVGGKLVHIPQAGSPSGVARNRKKLPATITRRKDIDIVYPLDELTTDPRLITNADKVELSYDAMDSNMTEDMMYLHQFVADSMLFNWKPEFYIKASGDAKADNTIYGTGVRTSVTVTDFSKAKSIFNKWNIPASDRYVILDTEQYDQLTAEFLNLDMSNTTVTGLYDAATGTLKKLEGFTIYQRSTVLLASNPTLAQVPKTKYFKWANDTDNLYTPEDYEEIISGEKSPADTAATVGLFWSKIAVARALGETLMFDDEGNPQYYGDIYSFLQRLGGRARRGDGKGVLGIIQATA